MLMSYPGNGAAHQSQSINSYHLGHSPGSSNIAHVVDRKPVLSAASGGMPININGKFLRQLATEA